jgi:hypothetical protein
MAPACWRARTFLGSAGAEQRVAAERTVGLKPGIKLVLALQRNESPYFVQVKLDDSLGSPWPL